MLTRIATITAATLFALGSPALADHHGHQGHGKPDKAKPANIKPGKPGTLAGKRAPGMACPPGLAKKPGCLPPGQWKKGDRLPESWAGEFIAYALLPDFYRSRHRIDSRHRYLYRDSRVFVIDAASRAILDVVTR